MQNELEPLLEAFHSNEWIQDQCREALRNASEYLQLLELEGDEFYVAKKHIPPGKRLAVYSGFAREAEYGHNTRRQHDLHIGDIGIGCSLVIDGSPGLSAQDDARPGRLQMINHGCEPHNNCVCTRELCECILLY